MGPSFTLTRGTERESTELLLRSIFIRSSSRNSARNHFFPSLLTQISLFRDRHLSLAPNQHISKERKSLINIPPWDGTKWKKKRKNTNNRVSYISYSEKWEPQLQFIFIFQSLISVDSWIGYERIRLFNRVYSLFQNKLRCPHLFRKTPSKHLEDEASESFPELLRTKRKEVKANST